MNCNASLVDCSAAWFSLGLSMSPLLDTCRKPLKCGILITSSVGVLLQLLIHVQYFNLDSFKTQEAVLSSRLSELLTV